MWRKRKPSNRRHERKHILDVKLRSSQRRQLWTRRLALILGGPLLALFGLYMAWRGGEWLLQRFLYENPAFAIHQIDVQTDGEISLEYIRRWAGVRLEENLFALDLARVKRDLELVPQIHSAAVERVLPHGLRIRITERVPIAQCYVPRARSFGMPDRGVFLLDLAGWVMPPLEPQQRATPPAAADTLPVLIGVPQSDLRPGKQVESPPVRAALRLIQAFEYSPMAGQVELKEIDLTMPNTLIVSTAQGNDIMFGWQDFEGQFRRWRAVHDHGHKLGKAIAWLDLSVANNVPALWFEAAQAPAPPPKPAKPSRKKKQHV